MAEMRKSFHVQLAEAEAVCVRMAGDALNQLHLALQALSTRDEHLADRVVQGDDVVDDAYMELESRVLTLLATQAPVASDLRLVSAMLHINAHLERIADLCVNIAKIVKHTRDLPAVETIVQQLNEMGAQAARMIETAIQSFSKRDLALALQLPVMDDLIDRLNREILGQIVGHADDERRLEWATRAAFVARHLERIGDNAVDVGEQVAFMITGQFQEFTDASRKDE